MSGLGVAQKLIHSHLLSGEMKTGSEIGILIDQTLSQDATGTLVMLELEAMGLSRVRTEISVQYVDHNLVQEDFKNADDHLFLLSAARRFGFHYCRPGTGVSHPVHQEQFGKPGKTLLGSDSHTPAAGALGMLAIGAGGLEVAMAIAGEPFFFQMPKVVGVRLTGKLPPWVSAKDVILEMLRRHSVSGGVNQIFEYHGPGLAYLSAMDRHVIANMGAEMGATTTVFPSDRETRRFLEAQGRGADWIELQADHHARYDLEEELDLSKLEPLIAMPSSPDNVKTVREVAGKPIAQAYIGSSANPGFRDFAIVAEIMKGERAPAGVSLDVNPSTRQILEKLVVSGHLGQLIRSGARLHQAGCNGCIGMGQAPATRKLSLRTVPRNFPGRSGTPEDQVCLVSPETAAASALMGVITDPRTLKKEIPLLREPANPETNLELIEKPWPIEKSLLVSLEKGPNIAALPVLPSCAERIDAPVLLKVADNISTDTIMPAGARVLPYRSNIPKIAEFCFERIAPDYHQYAWPLRNQGGHIIVAGENYGQGSSREHAALAPRSLGLQAVLAKSFARIHWQNLVNFGVLPLIFQNPADFDAIQVGNRLVLEALPETLKKGRTLTVRNLTQRTEYTLRTDLSPRQLEIFLEGGLINWMKQRLQKNGKISMRSLESRGGPPMEWH